MRAIYVLLAVALVLVVAAVVRSVVRGGRIDLATRIWLLVALIFVAVSTWHLFIAAA